MAEPETGIDQVRAVEVVASMCLATDLGMGLPLEHGLHATLITMRLCDVLGVNSETASQTYYAALLMHAGCTTEAQRSVHIFHGSMTEQGIHRRFGSALQGAAAAVASLPDPEARWPVRAYQYAVGIPRAAGYRIPFFRAYCEVAEMLADQLGVPPSISGILPLITERWDGRSHLRRAKGDEIPMPLRVAHVGYDAAYQRLVGDDDHVVDTIGRRGGHAFDPAVAEAFVANASDILNTPESVWEEVLAAEPKPWLSLKDEAIDRALAATGAFSDLASPYLSGHAAAVGKLAAAAGGLMGLSGSEVDAVRRAGYLHDVGRVAVHPRIWEKPGALTTDEWEQVRLHPYHTERVFVRSPFLAPLAEIACAHHERLDGSGYHRGINGASLPPATRLLAAADAFHSKIEPRAYREPFPPKQASDILAEKAREGKLDPEMVSAVVEAAGQDPPRMERPARLTEREVEVVAMLARGKQTKQVARDLGISIKTADRHIQNAYRKIGVSTRAGATLFAAEHGLVTWGELPISG